MVDSRAESRSFAELAAEADVFLQKKSVAGGGGSGDVIGWTWSASAILRSAAIKMAIALRADREGFSRSKRCWRCVLLPVSGSASSAASWTEDIAFSLAPSRALQNTHTHTRHAPRLRPRRTTSEMVKHLVTSVAQPRADCTPHVAAGFPQDAGPPKGLVEQAVRPSLALQRWR